MPEPSKLPEGAVVITPAEIYAEVRALTESVRTLIAQDTADAEKRRAVEASQADHEVRIRQLERALWRVTGAAAAIGSAVGTGVASLVRAAGI